MKVLFLCTGNSCRSQMAEGLARAAGAEAYSAGTEPVGCVHPLAVQVMAEIGMDISAQASKRLDMKLAQAMDAVITVCDAAARKCPVIPGVGSLHWPIPDPAKAAGSPQEVLNRFRAVRDELARRVGELLKETKGNRCSGTQDFGDTNLNS